MDKILVIDDDTDILIELQELLVSIDFSCVCASSAAAAFEELERHPDIGLIITDLRMPDQSGLRFIQTLKELRPERDIPVIVTSGHADMDDVISLFRNGAVDFLPKPIYYDHLVELLTRIFPAHPIV